MNCCQCQAIPTVFDEKRAVEDLKRYRQKGPAKTTGMLIEALKAEGVEGMALLDIGGGIGAIQHELLKAGVTSAVSVEASSAYIDAAKEEAERIGYADCTSFYHGDFTTLAPDIAPADIVTLDRVICCYREMQKLVELSSARAARLYGVVYPRDSWWVKVGIAIENLGRRLRRNAFRTYVHPPEEVEKLIRSNGLERHFYRTTPAWQVVVYAR